MEPGRGADSGAGAERLLTVGKTAYLHLCNSSCVPPGCSNNFVYRLEIFLFQPPIRGNLLFLQIVPLSVYFLAAPKRDQGLCYSPSFVAGNLAPPLESLLGSFLYCTLWGRSKFFLIALGPGIWPGNLYCSFLLGMEGYFFVVAVAKILDIPFQDWKQSVFDPISQISNVMRIIPQAFSPPEIIQYQAS